MLRKSIYTFIAVLFMATVNPALANDVLVVDIQKVFANSLSGKSLNSQVKEKTDAIRATRDKAQKDLEADAKKIEDQKTLLTPEALRAKADELRLKEIAKNQELQQELRKLETAQAAAQSEILKKLSPILSDVMKEKGADAIMEARLALISNPDINVTDVVVKRLDDSLKSVKLVMPKD
ncbi:MAG: OmpH family outer membrane protein [Parvibaculales bacterium]